MGYKSLTTLPLLVALAGYLEFGTCLLKDNDESETERIVGGQDAKNGRFPYTVALYYEGQFQCTGSIISETEILTAAHCVVSNETGTLDPESFHATAGDVNRSSSNVEYINFYRITPHPKYAIHKTYVLNDLAVLETMDRIPFSNTIQRICIASPKIGRLEHKRALAMGWGQTSRSRNDTSEILQYASQTVISNLKCQVYYLGRPVPNTVMCARGILSGVCYGDSGGPLVLDQGRDPVQVGIASNVHHLLECGKFLGPAGFVRVSSYTDFITKTAKSKVCVG